jgi:hypothetical protein
MMRHLLAAMLLALLSSASNASNEPPAAYLPLCAELDLAAITYIESASSLGEIAGETIAAAFFRVMDARKACGEGRVSEALAIYDDIAFD